MMTADAALLIADSPKVELHCLRLIRALAATLAFASACSGSDAPPNLVLITLDTTRADHLGLYGYEEARTPALDSFASEAVLYERAYSTSHVYPVQQWRQPLTGPASLRTDSSGRSRPDAGLGGSARA